MSSMSATLRIKLAFPVHVFDCQWSKLAVGPYVRRNAAKMIGERGCMYIYSDLLPHHKFKRFIEKIQVKQNAFKNMSL